MHKKFLFKTFTLFIGVVAFFILFFNNIPPVQAAVIYNNSNTYTVNSPDSSYSSTAFSTSFTPSSNFNNISFSYEGMTNNISTNHMDVYVYINGNIVGSTTYAGSSNATWSSGTISSSISNLTSGVSYPLVVRYQRKATYYNTPYSINLRNFSVNGTSLIMSGTLTSSASSCTIASGGSS